MKDGSEERENAGRKEIRITGKKARFRDVELDIYRRYVLIYEWIKAFLRISLSKQLRIGARWQSHKLGGKARAESRLRLGDSRLGAGNFAVYPARKRYIACLRVSRAGSKGRFFSPADFVFARRFADQKLILWQPSRWFGRQTKRTG